MEVVFLRRSDLQVLDFGYVDRNYLIVLDSVIPQKSTFEVNKQNITADAGDLLIVKDKTVNYIGIVVSLEEDASKFTTQVQTVDFTSILDINVKLNSYSGNIADFLYNIIAAAYVSNSDPKQRMPYLTINKDFSSVTGTLNYEADTLGSITSVVETLNKAYSIGVRYSLAYENGRISGIVLHIANCTKGAVIKHSLAVLSNLVISNDSTQTTNKIEFIPSSENIAHKSTLCYYLTKNGGITTNAYDPDRFTSVCSVQKIFKDADYVTLGTTAQTEMLSSSLEHNITFEICMDNKVIVPFKDINVGDFIRFIAPSKSYDTMVTQISLKNSVSSASITLGEYRGSLTDKIKLLSKK